MSRLLASVDPVPIVAWGVLVWIAICLVLFIVVVIGFFRMFK